MCDSCPTTTIVGEDNDNTITELMVPSNITRLRVEGHRDGFAYAIVIIFIAAVFIAAVYTICKNKGDQSK